MDSAISSALAALERDPDDKEMLASLHKALTQSPSTKADQSVLRALGDARRTHRERGDFEVAAALFGLEAELRDDEAQRAELYFERGKLESEELLDEGAAKKSWLEAKRLHPKDGGIDEALQQSELIEGNWQKIRDKYLNEMDGATDRLLASSLMLSVAELTARFGGSHGKGDAATEKFLNRALEVDPRNARAALRLQRLLKQAGRYAELAAFLEKRVDGVTTKEERVAVYVLLGDVLGRHLSRGNEAAEAYKKALGLDPAHPRALSAIEDLLTREQNWTALVRAFENALRAKVRSDVELVIATKLGQLLWLKLNNLEGAEEYFKRVRRADPTNSEMIEFSRQLWAKEPAKLLPVLQQAQKAETDPKKKGVLAVACAELAEKGGGPVEKTIDLWKAAWKADPQNPAAIAALRRLYEKTEKWNALLELLKEREALLPRDAIDERIGRLLEVVAIYRDRLHLDVMVINTYTQILTLKPDHKPSLAALAQKYEQLGRWNDLIGVLQRVADVSTDVDEKKTLLRRVAGLWVERFSNFNQAVRPLEDLYAIDPADDAVVAQLRDIYGKRRAWRALLDLERREMLRLPQAQQRAKLTEIAKLASDRLGDLREAIGLWNRALETDENDQEALTSLAALYEREKRYLPFAEVLHRLASKQTEPKARVSLLERLASIFNDRLGALDPAIETYREILDVMPGHQKTTRLLRDLYAQGGKFDELEKLYGAQKQWDELCEVLINLAEQKGKPADKLPIYRRVAELTETHGLSAEKLQKAYERILSAAPDDVAAAQKLAPIYRSQEKWPRLLAILETLVARSEGEEQQAHYDEIVTLADARLNQPQLAFDWARRAHRDSNDAKQAAAWEAQLEALAERADQWPALAEIFTALLSVARTDAEKLQRHRQLGNLHWQRLRDGEKARGHFAEVAKLAPDDEEARAALEEIYLGSGDFQQVLSIYRQKVEAERDPEKKIELLFKVAWLEEEQLGDAKLAAKTYEQVLGEGPKATAALRALGALERIYEAGGPDSRAALLGALERQLTHVADAPARRAGISYRIGELLEEQKRPDAEVLERYRTALSDSADQGETLRALERWFNDANRAPAMRAEVGRLLLPAFTRLQNWKAIAQVRQIELEAATDPMEKQLLLSELVTIYDQHLKDRASAFVAAGKIFDLDPKDADNLAVLRRLSDELDKADDFAVRLSDAVDVARRRGDNAEVVRLGWELGQVFESRLQMPLDAEAAYRGVLGVDPDHEAAHDALVRIYTAAERWRDLRGLLAARKSRTAEMDKKVDLLSALSELDEGVLEDDAAAMGDYRELLEIDPAMHSAVRALDRLYTRAGKWQELDQLLGEWESRLPEDESRSKLLSRRGELHLTKLDDKAGAVPLFEQALAEDDKDEASLRGLESLLTDDKLQLRAAQILAPHYEATAAWEGLVKALRIERVHAETSQAVLLLERIAKIEEEQIGELARALGTIKEALRIEPGSTALREQARRIGEAAGQIAELTTIFEESLTRLPSSDLQQKAEILAELGELYESELRDVARAKAAWRRLLDLDPQNPEIGAASLQPLERLYNAAEEWSELIVVLRKKAELTGDTEDKKDLLVRVGRIEEELLEKPILAIATYRQIVELDATDRGALDALERLYVIEEAPEQLAGVLQQKLQLENDGAKRRDLGLRLGQIFDRDLKQPADAITAYTGVLDEHPEDEVALAALAMLYKQKSQAADLLDILERRLQLAERGADFDDQINLRLELATLLQQAERREEALEHYRKILALDASHDKARAGLEVLLDDADLRLTAAEVLEPVYEASADLPALVRTSELYAEHAPDLSVRIERLRKVCELRLKLNQPDQAFAALSQAVRIGLGESELGALLDRIEQLGKTSFASKLIALYREVAPDVLDSDLQERIYRVVAELAEKQGDLTTARDYYKKMADARAEDKTSLDALEKIYATTKDHESLYELYARRADLAGDDEVTRRHYLMLLGKLASGPLGRTNEAIRAFEQVLDVFPSDDEATEQLLALYRGEQRAADLADLYERRLQFVEDLDEAVRLRFELAQVCEQNLGDTERAVDNYRAALGGDPEHAGAIAALERFLTDTNLQRSAAEVLEPVYAMTQAWQKLGRVFEIRLAYVDIPDDRIALVQRIARLCEEQIKDLDQAFVWYGRLFREDPADRWVREQLGRLSNLLGDWRRLADVYEGYLTDHLADGGPVVAELLRILAAIYGTRLHDVDGARSCYLRLIELDRGDEAAFLNLEQLLGRAERWQELSDAYRDAIESADHAEQRKVLLHKRAELLETKLNDVSGAIEELRAVLDLDEHDGKALAELDRLYAATDRNQDLVELTVRKLDAATPAQRIGLECRLGALYEQKLKDPAAAIDAYERVLALSPGEPTALQALERMVKIKDEAPRITQILEPIYRQLDNWEKLVMVLEAQLPFTDDPKTRIDRLREIAGLHEQRGGDGERAFAALARAFSTDVADGAEDEANLYDELVRLAIDHRLEALLAELLIAEAGKTQNNQLKAVFWQRVAELQSGANGNVNAAIESYQKVLELEPNDEQVHDALIQLYDRAARPRDLVAALARRAEITDDPTAQIALWRRAAALQEAILQNLPAAIEAWQRVLALDDDDEAALESLIRLYAGVDDPRSLAEMLQKKATHSADPETKNALRFELAQLQEERLKDVTAAIDTLIAITVDDENNAQALAQLAKLYAEQSRWAEEVDALDRLAEISDEPEKSEIQLAAARRTQKELRDAEAAVPRYRAVLESAASTNVAAATQALAALEALLGESETMESAANALEPYYQAQADWGKRIALAERRIAASNDSDEKRQGLLQIAELEETGRKDLARAFDAWVRLLDEEPADDQVVGNLERLAAAQGNFAALANVFERHAKDANDPELQRAFYRRLGDVRETHLADESGAITAYDKVFDLGGDEDPEVLEALDRLLLAARAWPRLAQVLEKKGAVGEATEQAQTWARLGHLRLRELRQPKDALAAFREAIDRNPEEPLAVTGLETMIQQGALVLDALQILEPLAEDNAIAWLGLAETRLRHTESLHEQVALLERIAERSEHEAKDASRALGALGRALELQPDQDHLLEGVERLGKLTSRETQVAELLEQLLGKKLDDDATKKLALAAARIWEQLDLRRAEPLYLRVLAIDPEHEEAEEALERLYRARGDAPKLAETLWKRAERALDPTEKTQRYHEAAKLFADVVKQPERAIAAYKAAVQHDESDMFALDELAKLYEAAGQIEALAETLEQRVRYEEDAGQQVGYRMRIAQLYRSKLGDPARAAASLRDLLDRVPSAEQALDMLAEIEEERQDWLALSEVLQRQLAATSPGRGQLPIYHRLAAVALDKMGSIDDAIMHLHEAMSVVPDDRETSNAIIRLYEQAERWHDLIDLYTTQAGERAQAGDSKGELERLVRIADLWLDRLDSPDSAAEILERILAKDPSNVRALSVLSGIYEKSGDLDRCRALLQQALGLAKTGNEKAEIYFRMGRLVAEQATQQGGDPDQAALGDWQKAVEADPTYLPANQALEKLAEKAGDRATVAWLLDKRLAAQSTEEKKDTLRRLVEIYDAIGQGAAAAAALEQALQLAPEDAALREALGDRFLATGELDRALAIFQTMLEQKSKQKRGKELGRLQHKIGAVAERRGDAALAAEQYAAAFQTDPTYPPTLIALGRQYVAASDWEKARRYYRQLLMQNAEPAQKCEAYTELGKIHETLNEGPKAAGMYERALELDPKNATLQAALKRVRGR